MRLTGLIGRFGTNIRLLPAACALLLALLFAPAPAGARPDGGAILTPIAMEVLDAPVPVRGADGRKHLAYEVAIANHSALDVTIRRVQARAGGLAFGKPLTDTDFAEHLRVFGHDGETTIPAGGNAVLFLDLRYGPGAGDPDRLTHLWRLSTADPEGIEPDKQVNFIGVRTKVSRERPLEITPPLRGPRWLDANGCCMPIGGHRGGTLAVDGTLHVGERYAIDFVGLDAEHRLFEGPQGELSSYGFYGAPVRSATSGRVVEILDGEPEQVPGILPTDLKLPQYGGNFVTVRIDPEHFAFYAHLRPGRIPVEVGDRVKPGQKLGELGNTGNSNAPHLHFQIMDGRSPLQSNGLPFVFDQLAVEGYVPDLSGMPEGDPMTVDERYAGRKDGRMPIAQQLLGL